MFADSLLETSWSQRSRRSWTTLTSFGLQAVIVGLLLLLPLFHPESLPPLLRRLTTPISASRMPAEAPPAAQANTAVQSNFANNRLMTPSRIPIAIVPVVDDAPLTQGPTGPYIPGLDRIGDVRDSIGVPPVLRPVMPVSAPPAVAHTIRISHMSEGDLIRKVQPTYPPLARSARIQGSVVLAAVISKEGTIENLRVHSGHPMLVPAAIEAVKQWRYRPYVLNNEPLEVETQITVNFSLSGS
jgi:protein TonB